MPTLAHDPTVVQHQDLIRMKDRADALSNNEDGSVLHLFLQRMAQSGIGLEIQCRKAVVKDI